MRIDYDKAAGKAAMEAYEADASALDALIEQLGLRG